MLSRRDSLCRRKEVKEGVCGIRCGWRARSGFIMWGLEVMIRSLVLFKVKKKPLKYFK